mmetsp:Transcript_13213/g.41641  ORF Transcript_13213/g.41641 Transcript_13213/m.41641 type:complete len:94 (-) Transcript_13213:57-338(-)
MEGFIRAVRDVEAKLGGGAGTAIPRVFYAHWTIESFYLAAVRPYTDIYDTHFAIADYRIVQGDKTLGLAMPVIFGLVWRALAAVIIIFTPPSI